MGEELRKTGLEVIGDVPWGTHFCQFYQTAQDLVDILVPYFAAGLRNNEFCMWVTSEPLGVEAARAAMKAALPEFDDYVRKGQIEIISQTDWYLKGGNFDSERVLKGWVTKLDKALSSGFDGLRLTGNTLWLEPKDWRAFTDYEEAVDRVIGRYRMLAVCAYSLDRCGFNEILDVIRNHRFALVRREGRWELVESAERKQAYDELKRSAQFPEQNPNPVFRVAIKGDLIYANPAALSLLEAIGGLKGGPLPLDILAMVREAAERSSILDAEVQDDGGRTFWFSAIRPAGETYVNLYGHDITDRKQAGAALRQAKDELEIRVKERTAELQQSNERLKEEIEERVRTEKSLKLEEARLDGLLRLNQMSESPLNEITGFTLEQAIALTQSKIGFVGFLNEDESIYTLHAVSKDVVKECNVTGDPVQWHVVDAGIWADAIKEHRTLFINDYSKPHPRKKGLPPGHPYVERFMVVPILEGERIVALAGVGNKAVGYDRSDERQIALLLSGMWSCVRKNRSREELQNAYNELEEKVRQRTASLRESEERHRLLFDTMLMGVVYQSADGAIISMNPAAEHILGKSPEDFLGETSVSVEHDTIREDGSPFPGLEHPSMVALRTGQEVRGVVMGVFNPRERQYRWINVNAIPLFHDSDNMPYQVYTIFEDITERKKVEALRQALAEQEKLRLGAAVELASDAVVMIDPDGRIKYVNASFETINRISRDAVVDSSYFDLLAGDPPEGAIRESVAKGKPWHGHLTRPVPGGRSVELEVTISPTHDPSGTVIGGLITEKDVTYENALQRQVRQAQKMEALGTLAGGITHDFNNILGAIMINTELALLDLPLTHPARAALPAVLQAANRGKELVKQIITFSRQREWEKKPLEVAPVIKEVMTFLRSTLPKDVAIHETIASDCGSVMGDPSHLHQILVNLCQNAALAMQENGGNLEVKLEPVDVDAAMAMRHPDLRPGAYVRLMVADTGCGMARELMERIFEPFFTTRKHGEGSGLGLAVVHGIVKGYDGAITVYSEPGKGSVFSVYLPRIEGAPGTHGADVLMRPVAGKERILLVEDERAQRTSLAQSLQRLGYTVTARAEGRSALTVFRKDPKAFDVVITDQIMPRMSGLDLAEALVKLRPDIPVILCTGFSEKVNGGSVGKSGIREFLMKPFTLQEISRLISKVLKKESS